MKRPLIYLSFVILLVNFLYGCGGTGDLSSAFYPNPGGSGNSITLSWRAPATNEDGSTLMDLAGYRVYYGENSRDYTNFVSVGANSSCSIGDLPTGKIIYFAVTAFDTYGNESYFSNEVSTVL